MNRYKKSKLVSEGLLP